MNKNSLPMPFSQRNDKPPLQFTELTTEDVMLQEDLCIQLLLQDKGIPMGNKGNALYEMKCLFQKEFGIKK